MKVSLDWKTKSYIYADLKWWKKNNFVSIICFNFLPLFGRWETLSVLVRSHVSLNGREGVMRGEKKGNLQSVESQLSTVSQLHVVCILTCCVVCVRLRKGQVCSNIQQTYINSITMTGCMCRASFVNLARLHSLLINFDIVILLLFLTFGTSISFSKDVSSLYCLTTVEGRGEDSFRVHF